MAIKSREKNKFYIEQIIVDTDNNPATWTSLENVIGDRKLIGYLFSTKEGVKFAPAVQTLNVYLIDPKFYADPGISLSELRIAWYTFEDKCKNTKSWKECILFKNPPIKEWLDTKENWCKKLASKLATKYHKDFEDMLSEVYYVIMNLYNKPKVYMGNLGYIQTSVVNSILVNIRFNRNRLNSDSSEIAPASLDAEVENSDGDPLCYYDLIGVNDPGYEELDYQALETSVKTEMLKTFSPREIDQIINNKGYLPGNLYKRLTIWRKKHSPKELIRLASEVNDGQE